jgi:hypothetical protein
VQGTSFASPLVAASAALIRSHWPTMSAANVVQRLITTAHDAGPTGRDNLYGFGIVGPLRGIDRERAHRGDEPARHRAAARPLRIWLGPAAAFDDDVEGDAVAPVAAAQLSKHASTTQPFHERPVTFVAALAGFAVLVGGGLTLIRRL